MMIEKLKRNIKQNEKLLKFSSWLISPPDNPKPRLWVKLFFNPFVHKKGKGSIIRWKRSRIDVFPWKRFEIGQKCTIEDFTTINNGAGDVILGNKVRIGIGSVVIGPVIIKDGCGLGQHVFISGSNHCYQDGTKNSSEQQLDKREVIIDEDTHIGANAVVVAGVHIGKRCQIGAGSVVTKNIPDYSIAVGNPAKVIKRYDLEQKQWIKV